MSVISDDLKPLTMVFADDGLVPNSPLPFLVYKRAIALDNAQPEKTIEKLFDADRKSTRLNSSHLKLSRMPSSA